MRQRRDTYRCMTWVIVIGFMVYGSLRVAAGEPRTASELDVMDQIRNKISEVTVTEKIKKRIQKVVWPGSSRKQVQTALISIHGEPWYADSKSLKGKEYKQLLQESNYKLSQLSGVIQCPFFEPFEQPQYYLEGFFFIDKSQKLLTYKVYNYGSIRPKQVPGKPTVEQVRAMVKKGIPPGSNLIQVKAWLQRQKIEYGYIDGKKFDLNNESVVFYSKHKVKNLSGIIIGLIRHTMVGPISETHTQIVFFFDKRGRYIDASVETTTIAM